MSKNETRITHTTTEVTRTVDMETGEVMQEQTTEKFTKKIGKEPPYVKLYLDHLSRFKGLQLSLNPILALMLQRATYADETEEDGGMILYLNRPLKADIAKKCGVGLSRVDHAVTEFVKKEYFRRLDLGKYQVNPNLFGKGEWKDIENIRATFDYGTGEVAAEIVKTQENELNKAYDKITGSQSLTEEQKEQLKLLAEKYDIADIIKIFNKTLNAEVDKKTVEYAETLDSEVKRAETELNTIKKEMETFQQTAQAGGL